MDPPIQTEYFLSGGAMILILMVEGARAVISFCILSHTHHHTLMSRATNNGWEDSSGSVISGKSSLAHAGAIVNHQSCNIFITHSGGVLSKLVLDTNSSSSIASPCTLR